MCWVQEVVICRPDLADPKYQVQALFLFLFPFRMFLGFDFWPFKSTDGKIIEGYHSFPACQYLSISGRGKGTGNISSLKQESLLCQAECKVSDEIRGINGAESITTAWWPPQYWEQICVPKVFFLHAAVYTNLWFCLIAVIRSMHQPASIHMIIETGQQSKCPFDLFEIHWWIIVQRNAKVRCAAAGVAEQATAFFFKVK